MGVEVALGVESGEGVLDLLLGAHKAILGDLPSNVQLLVGINSVKGGSPPQSFEEKISTEINAAVLSHEANTVLKLPPPFGREMQEPRGTMVVWISVLLNERGQKLGAE